MINVNDFKTGMTIKVDNNIYTVVEFQHVKPGKGAAFVKTKLKNLRTGATVEHSFNSGVKVERAHVEKQNTQFLYSDGDTFHFMNMNTYEQMEINRKQIEEEAKYLKENMDVDLVFYEGELIGINLPDKVSYIIKSTEPAVKGNTTNNATKDAVIETGLTVRVPLFISEGEEIIISTKDGKYVSRA